MDKTNHWLPFIIEIILDQKTKKLQIKEFSDNVDISSLGMKVNELKMFQSRNSEWRVSDVAK